MEVKAEHGLDQVGDALWGCSGACAAAARTSGWPSLIPYNQMLHVTSSITYTAVLDVRRATAGHLGSHCANTASGSAPARTPVRWASSDRRCWCCAGSS